MTKRTKYTTILGVLIGAAVLMVVTPALAQESGAAIWGRTCARCHRAFPPNKYDSDFWKAIMGHMALNARLTPDEEEAVTDFLTGAARPLSEAPDERPSRVAISGEKELVQIASTDTDLVVRFLANRIATGEAIYEAQCAVCHGEEGKGDGPAAPALTPRPVDLTTSEVLRSMTDPELLLLLENGKGSMPGFGRVLSDEELRLVVIWVRALTE
jgi:mono/diheme cytochrome c family protein